MKLTLKEMMADLDSRTFLYHSVEHLAISLLLRQDSLLTAYFRNSKLNPDMHASKLLERIPKPCTIDAKIVKTPRLKKMIADLGSDALENEVTEYLLKTPTAFLWYLREISSSGNENTGSSVNNKSGIKVASSESSPAYSPDFPSSPVPPAVPNLSRHGVNLTMLAYAGKLPPVVSREKEYHEMMEILLQKTNNNPMLVGKSGVGKTAVVEGLAQYLITNNDRLPLCLRDRWIFTLEVSKLVSNTKFRGEFDEKVADLLKEIREHPEIIIFIDEFHTIVGAGRTTESAQDFANILKPPLSRGEIRLIGATTSAEYSKYIVRDPAFERRFSMVDVRESTIGECLTIMKTLRPMYELHHNIEIDEALLPDLIKKSVANLPFEKIPAGPIKILDRSCAKALLGGSKNLSTAFIDNAVAELGRIELGVVQVNPSEKYKDLARNMNKSVIGQDQAISVLTGMLASTLLHVGDTNKPLGVFFFSGPTGCGKTLIAQTLGRVVFGSEELFLRIEMGSYSSAADMSRLIGSSAGYVGYEDGGILTNHLRRHPSGVVLLDEVEKADGRILNLFLSAFDDGFINDAKGGTYSCRNIIFILTSNITEDSKPVGFYQSEKNSYSSMEESNRIKEHLRNKGLKPEFINRLDSVIEFNKLSRENLAVILDIHIGKTRQMFIEQGFDLDIETGVKQLIVRLAFRENMGARPLDRLLRDLITQRASIMLLEKSAAEGTKIQAVLNEDGAVEINLDIPGGVK